MNDATAIADPESRPAVPEPDMLYEIVNGQIVEQHMGAFETSMGSLIVQHIGTFANEQNLGRGVNETLFRLAEDLPQRRPDVAFVSYQRWPKGRRVPSVNAWPVVPDLAVEVVSPFDLATETFTKIGEYFQAGVRVVWLVIPALEQVYVYRSLAQIKVIERPGELDGEDVLPGFRLPLALVFERDESDPTQAN